MSSAILFLLSCTFGPPTPARCAALSAGESRDNCWAEVAPELFRAQGHDAIAIIENGVSDRRVRDYIWLTVTREVAPQSDVYCSQISAPAIAERCRVYVRRPHLHKAMEEASDQPAQGQPPPGSLPGDAATGL